jgi:hypothetical protein
MECGRKFRTIKTAERAVSNGCPNCGSVDVDIDVDAPRIKAATEAGPDSLAAAHTAYQLSFYNLPRE